MQNHQSKSSKNSLNSVKLLICQQFLGNFKENNRLEQQIAMFSRSNKRHLRADVLSLLSSALRPRLLGVRRLSKKSENQGLNQRENITNRGSFGLNVAKIVVLSTICPVLSMLFVLFGFLCGFSSSPVSASSLTLTIPSDPLSLDLNPTVNNGFNTTTSSFSVKTDNSSGYTVSIKAKNSNNDDVSSGGSSSTSNGSSLVNGDHKLLSISEAVDEDTFKNDNKFINTWGWLPSKLNGEDNTNYQVAPGVEEVVLDTTKGLNEEDQDYSISLAAKVDSTTIAGSYTNTFIINATTNEEPAEGIMQEWNSCDSLDTEQSIKLLDSRDNNVYTITKLKDGKCWMTENLRISGDSVKAVSGSAVLDQTNTDIASGSFTLPDSNLSKFNLGSMSSSTTQWKENDAVYVGNVSYQDPDWGAKNFESGYYTWHTATAGTGTASQTTQGWNAPSSICPKGWHLPKGGSNGEFQQLTTAYGITSNAEGSKALRGEPLNFTCAGAVYSSSGSLYFQGSVGVYWSSTVSDTYPAYYLFFNSSGVDPARSNNRPSGYSVRCVAE